MIDVQDDHSVLIVVDAVADPVLTTARPPQTQVWLTQRNTNNTRRIRKRSDDELPGGEGGRRGQRGREGSSGAGR